MIKILNSRKDVAIFMQAHKTHPLQFEDDCKRDSSGYMKTRTNIDLGKIVRGDIIYK